MKQADIKVGETYMFVATDSPSRKHLEGEPFTVSEIRPVWRRIKRQSRKVKRFFNEAGDAARADELEPMGEKTLQQAGFLTDTAVTMDFNDPSSVRTVLTIKCANCGWVGEPKDLAVDDTSKRVKEVCPNCGEEPDPF